VIPPAGDGSGRAALGLTLPQLLAARAGSPAGRRTALRYKDRGIWQEFTWADYQVHARAFGLGLLALGLQPGEKVAILSDNRPEWLYAEMGTLAVGGIVVGVYQDAIAREIGQVIDHADATYVVAEDQEQLDKVLEVRGELPKVRRIITIDPKGMHRVHEPGVLPFPEVEDLGRRLDAEQPGRFVGLLGDGKPEDIANIVYTSGTTGSPKGAMLTHRNLINMAVTFTEVDPVQADDQLFSYLPMPWIGEIAMAIATALTFGLTVNFPEEVETTHADGREIGPTMLFGPPRLWEALTSQVQVKIMDTTPFKRAVFQLAMRWGYRVADKRLSRQPVTLADRCLHRLGHLLAFRAVLDDMAMLRIRHAYTGGAALGPDTFRFLRALGLNIKQLYGQTEIAGYSCVHRDDDVRFETVGRPTPGVELKLSPNGEILERSDSVFLGYYKDPQATREALEDGWLHTGDAGSLTEEGHLVVIDRLADVMRLADGTLFSPQFIENKLKFSPFIREAVVVGHGRPYVTAIVNIEMPVVGKWAEDRQIAYTTYTDLSQKAAVYTLVAGEIREANATLPAPARIRRFVLLYKELDADDGELTRTRKVRRRVIAERYTDLIEAMYSGRRDRVPVRATITYQDGTTAVVETGVRVEEVAGA
jgi:long-chain acyl-CoA synthetase